MAYNPSNPLIVQGDKSVLLEVKHFLYEEVRDELSKFAELEKSPEFIHTYRISPLSLWNAASSGLSSENIIDVLERYGKFDLPQNVRADIDDTVKKYGKIKLERYNNELVLSSEDRYLMAEIAANKKVSPYITDSSNPYRFTIDKGSRGHIKHLMIKMGLPVKDLAGYSAGTHFNISFKQSGEVGQRFSLRDYQREAVDIFHAGGSDSGGSGVIVLPCGAGKTVVGMAAMDMLQCETLILTTNITALRQWRDELLDKMAIPEDCIGEYSGEIKEIKPVTITTYQILTYRNDKSGDFPHLDIFSKKDWGFIIYDEVHLLPAPVFRITAEDASVAIQISGTFGSRQEEAQRLGRILRPKQGENRAYFYNIVTAESREQEFAANRQRFLTEQGYRYHIINPDYLDEIFY